MVEKLVVIDNDQYFLDAVLFYFQNETEFEVRIVRSDESSNEQIVAMFQEDQVRPHLIITGVRNLDDHDPRDYSGLNLAKMLKHHGIPVLVWSSPEYKDLAEKLDVPFVMKAEGLDAINQKIRLFLDNQG